MLVDSTTDKEGMLKAVVPPGVVVKYVDKTNDFPGASFGWWELSARGFLGFPGKALVKVDRALIFVSCNKPVPEWVLEMAKALKKRFHIEARIS
jgi:hypothetical protein